MHEPIVSREVVAQQAERAVREMLASGLTIEVQNPYPTYSRAAIWWKLHVTRLLESSGAPDLDGGA